MWKGVLGEAVVWYGAAAEIRVVSVTSLLAWAVTISTNVNQGRLMSTSCNEPTN